MTPQRADHKVLVIAPDPMLAALIGALVETARLHAAFPAEGERPEDALARVRPLAAILMAAAPEGGGSESDLFLARARKRRVEVMLFGRAAAVARLASWARERGVPAFVLPGDVERLQRALEQLQPPAAGGAESRRGAERRVASAMRAADGTLIFDDGVTKWSVYDRRASGDRRQVGREFVSENGDVRRCEIAVDEARSILPATLARQLERATPEPE